MALLAHRLLTWHPVLFCLTKETINQRTCEATRLVEIPCNSVCCVGLTAVVVCFCFLFVF